VIGITLLGSTGSIGLQTLEVIRAAPDRYRLVGLAAGHASPDLEVQAREWPETRVWAADGTVEDLDPGRWADGGLPEVATLDGVDLVVVATTGMTALPAVLAALAAGRRVALANKETLVAGGHLVHDALPAESADRLDWLRPIDSEHSAIWQCLRGERMEDVARLILTASGGPFRDRDPADLAAVTPADALAHPTWQMGPKITIDSATLVNKAFEAIEAKWLYDLPYSKISAVLHPGSIVHSLVEFVDGSFKAQLGLPDMRLPIQFALSYPARHLSPARTAGPEDWPALTFAPLTRGPFPAYDTVRAAAEAGGNRGTVVNAADEVAITAFLVGAIRFPDIAATIARAVDRWGSDDEPDLDELTALDKEVRTRLESDLGIGAAA
jgi:1-deoxy-D-xylulose-5-phosphate reductoisomerase